MRSESIKFMIFTINGQRFGKGGQGRCDFYSAILYVVSGCTRGPTLIISLCHHTIKNNHNWELANRASSVIDYKGCRPTAVQSVDKRGRLT